MSNKVFIPLVIVLVLAPFFAWMVYDSNRDSESIRDENVRRDLLVDGGGGSGAQIQYLFHFPDPVYHHDLSTAQIEGLSHDAVEGEHYHVDGLTLADYKVEALYQFNFSKKWFKNQYTMWVEDLRVDFSYTTVNVYVTSAYPEGSCEYQATLDHENQHVAVHKRVYEQYQRILEQALADAKDIPLESHPVTTDSWEQGKAQIARMISAVTDPVFDQFKQAVTAAQDELDTPESYSQLRTRCQNW